MHVLQPLTVHLCSLAHCISGHIILMQNLFEVECSKFAHQLHCLARPAVHVLSVSAPVNLEKERVALSLR